MGEEEEMLKIKVSCFREQNIQKQFLRLTYYDRCMFQNDMSGFLVNLVLSCVI